MTSAARNDAQGQNGDDQGPNGSEQQETGLGRLALELDGRGEALTLHLDRRGFRRLLKALETLAEGGLAQDVRTSGRGSRGRIRRLTLRLER